MSAHYFWLGGPSDWLDPVQVRLSVGAGGTAPVDLLSEYNPTGDTETVWAEYNTAIHVCIIQIIAAYLCYIFGQYNP